MNPGSDEQTELLRNIWNEMKALGQNLGGRIDQTNTRLDQTNVRLDRLESEVKDLRLDLNTMAGHMQSLADQQVMLTRVVRTVVDRQDAQIGDIRERLARLEARQQPG
jgi:hypothetical protein